MAVLYYAEGDHDSGFIGFRVATSIGTEDDYRQKYFSLNEYGGYDAAKQAAHELNDRWRAQARETIRANKIFKLDRDAGPNQICRGLRGAIVLSKKDSGNDDRHYYYQPAFKVSGYTARLPEKAFRMSLYGYEQAFEQAVIWFCGIHRLDKWQQLALMEMIPDRSLFTGYLYNSLLLNGHKGRITRQQIRDKLD